MNRTQPPRNQRTQSDCRALCVPDCGFDADAVLGRRYYIVCPRTVKIACMQWKCCCQENDYDDYMRKVTIIIIMEISYEIICLYLQINRTVKKYVYALAFKAPCAETTTCRHAQ